MKEFLLEFLKLLSNCILIICFTFTSFLLMINFYHHEETALNYSVNLKDDVRYKAYKSDLKKIDKKMKSVNTRSSNYALYGKVIRDYYDSCSSKLEEASFNSFDKDKNLNAKLIYNLNGELLNDINNVCLVSMPVYINSSSKEVNFINDFDEVNDVIVDKRNILVNNARYLRNSSLGNSSYSFSTEIFRRTIYNRLTEEFDLTVDNYGLAVSILNDIADWYVAEFGGNA